MRDKVGRANKINVVTASPLQLDHYPAQLIKCDGLPLAETADLIILTENAAQVAVRHEDGA